MINEKKLFTDLHKLFSKGVEDLEKLQTKVETEANYVDGETGYECPRCKHVFGNDDPGYVPTCSIDDCNDHISENNQGVSDLILHTKLTFPDLTQEMPAKLCKRISAG